jgi:hypothetical protein
MYDTSVSVNGRDGLPAWVCSECGEAHLKVKVPWDMGYNDKLDPDVQVRVEEHIASTIFDYEGEKGVTESGSSDFRTLDEEDCARLGRSILLTVLKEFRPDLFSPKEG